MRIIVIVTLLALPLAARAQCTKDTDCKGDRVCNAGTCVEPTATTAPPVNAPPPNYPPANADVPPPPPPPPPPAYVPSSPSTGDFADKPMFYRPNHWAGGAAVLGFIGTALILPSGIGASFITSYTGTLVGAAVLLTAAILGPIVAIGSGSARRNGGVPGVAALRVIGLISYVLGMAAGAATVVVGLVINPSPALGITSTVLGSTGLLFMSIDSLVSSVQASKLPAPPPRTRAEAPLLVPVLTATRSTDGRLAPMVGVGGIF